VMFIVNVTSIALLILTISNRIIRVNAIKSTDACQYPVKAEFGTVCMCYDTECVRLPSIPSDGSPLIVTSSYEGGYMEVTTPSTSSNDDAQMKIDIKPDQTFQEIYGFGGAITDATALQYKNLNKNLQAAFVNAFYDEENGAGFTYTRVPMNSADFSRKNYVHSSKLDLSDWCLRDDNEPPTCGTDYKITPTLQDIVSKRPDLKVYISSWSAPPTYKDQDYQCKKVDGLYECQQTHKTTINNNCTRTVADPDTCNSQNKQGEPCQTIPPRDNEPAMSKEPSVNADGNCYNAGFLKENAMKAWATFYERYITEIQDKIENLKVWGVTSQNEPLTQTGLWGSNFMSQENETTFVGEYLSPILKKAFGTDFKIMTHDDQVVTLADRALNVARDLFDHVDGVAYHWYQALEATFENSKPEAPLNLPSWIVANKVGGGADVKTVFDAFHGTKFMLMTEACSGYSLGTSCNCVLSLSLSLSLFLSLCLSIFLTDTSQLIKFIQGSVQGM
jgi:O-glycosyl hydrolase